MRSVAAMPSTVGIPTSEHVVEVLQRHAGLQLDGGQRLSGELGVVGQHSPGGRRLCGDDAQRVLPVWRGAWGRNAVGYRRPRHIRATMQALSAADQPRHDQEEADHER